MALYDFDGLTADCEDEFGPHDHNDDDCGQMLSIMIDGYFACEEYGFFDRDAEEEVLGRPLFPNEY